MIVTKVHLLESLVYRGMGNFPKNKASGTHLISYRSQLDLLSSPPPAPECGEYARRFPTILGSPDDPVAPGVANILRIIEPYSVVEIEHVAELVGQERQGVESKFETCVGLSEYFPLSFFPLRRIAFRLEY
ncbi:hypothetical protein D9611_013038 [Ephemerocybe angulata]|uniref:Uncharacterized protein n=1 Tax=Ephemerocybe angulata TaxID=980116 RepID=A0A8H5AUD7_9AGAR|nr:hypothetical protein D9611_013038 [Tulosesus angulatus]